MRALCDYMTKQYIDALIGERLGGDRSRVVELFEKEEILDELNRHSKIEDWFHFAPRSYDGAYLVKTGNEFSCFYQEKGRAQAESKFNNLKEAAAYFFKSEGYIE